MVEQSSPWTKTRSSPSFTMKSSICTTPLFRNESFLRQKYELEGLSARQIAVLIQCSHSTINRALDDFGITKSKRQGGWVEYGWKMKNGKRVPHVRQQRIIDQIMRWKNRGWSYRKIAKLLSSRGVKSPSGIERWSIASLRRVLGVV